MSRKSTAKSSVSTWANSNILSRWVSENYNDIIDCDMNFDIATPETDPLLIKISEYLEIDKKNIMLGSGISGLLYCILNDSKWSHVHAFKPEFGLYELILSESVHKDNHTIHTAYEKSDLLNAVKSIDSNELQLLCFSSPRWFNGEKLASEHIIEILDNFKGTVLIDEAYFEFSRNKDDILKLAIESNRIILLRSFSKGLYVPYGLRVGYAIAKTFMLSDRKKKFIPHVISTPSANLIINLLSNDNMMTLFENSRKHVIEIRCFMLEFLLKFSNIQIVDSEANFITLIFLDEPKSNKYMKIEDVTTIGTCDYKGVKYWISNKANAQEFLLAIIDAFA